MSAATESIFATDAVKRIFTRPNFSQSSRRIRVYQLSYESKTTDKREQYDWRADKKLDGYFTDMAVSAHTYMHA